MSAGLPLSEQVEKCRKSGIEPRAGSVWSGRLEEWLAAVLPPTAYELIESDGAEPALWHDVFSHYKVAKWWRRVRS